MNNNYNNQDQIWPRDWMGNDTHSSEDNLIFMDGKERWEYLKGKPRHLKKKSKVESVIQYLSDLIEF